MDDHEYGMMDLTQYLNGRPIFSSNIQPHLQSDFLCNHQHYEMVMATTVPQHDNCLPHPTATATARPSVSGGGGGGGVTFSTASEMEGCGGGGGGGAMRGGGDGGNGRWPRQETLTLLEVRSQLDSKFKEANQKGPLWDGVSRIMSEEHGYQRSGKKCREKFENLYKYYKKTKEGKAGRQDGKHYRYFRQLEALYGKTSNTISISETNNIGSSNFHYNAINNNNQEAHNFHPEGPKLSDSLNNLSDSSDSDHATSSDDSELNTDNDLKKKRKKRRGKRSWKATIRDFVDIQMKKLIEKQEAWLEKMMKTIEHKEQERILREEEWRKQESIRIENEQKFWAGERAWIQARDTALIDALRKLSGDQELIKSNKNASICKDMNWDDINRIKCNKKQKENSLSSYYNFKNNEEGRSYCETSRHVPNVHQMMDPGMF
ncbi:trihelix transcription factor PTL-like [Nicotiana tomentosiformis]|uniref:trihelix transcription factor PTL-like n=1 Tax=Nicotiana tomentosiformis TaxID=4098 RepID=UPI00051BC509|nr:trihelix transcription factor PTL-like [Nicotiana tomentosiformis]XP_033516471.1 trihelix transcription factor PTL-like [Nicotiana tomentosiformis]